MPLFIEEVDEPAAGVADDEDEELVDAPSAAVDEPPLPPNDDEPAPRGVQIDGRRGGDDSNESEAAVRRFDTQPSRPNALHFLEFVLDVVTP